MRAAASVRARLRFDFLVCIAPSARSNRPPPPSLAAFFPPNFTGVTMWKNSGRSLFQTLILENFKFILFVVDHYRERVLFWNDTIVDAIVRDRQYVRYPPEGERPPTNEQEVVQAVEAKAQA